MLLLLSLISIGTAFVMLVLFAGAEKSIATISRDSVERMVELKGRGARLTLAMIRNKRRFQLMLMIGRVISITFGTAALFWFGIIISEQIPLGRPLVLAISTVGSILLFVIAEGVVANLVSVSDNERRVARFGYPLYFFHILSLPLTAVLDRFLSKIIKETEELAAKEEDFIEMVKSQSESGVLEEDAGEMIRSIFEFSDTTVREVMIPRIDMVAADKNIPLDDLLSLFHERGHSRIPIYDDRIDNITGLIYAKDLLAEMAEKKKADITLQAIMRNAFYVPENKKISVLLKEFKQAKIHIAIVVDEYGGTAGIVALEDLLEEIVGEIQDEYDPEDEHNYTKISEHRFIIDAGLDIDDVNTIIRSTIPNKDFDTLAGFIYHQLGFIPKGGEVITWEHYSFTIKELIGNRISKVLVEIHEPKGNGRESNGLNA